MLQELFKKFNTSKKDHSYSKLYESDFKPMRQNKLNILEVGILHGESIRAWLEYFPYATIYVIDTFERILPNDVSVLRNPYVNYAKLDSTSAECKQYFKDLGIQFDFIIDDGQHTPESQRLTFENLIEFTNNYYIEDVWNLDGDGIKNDFIADQRIKNNNFTVEKWNALIQSVNKQGRYITHHDWRKTHKPDSYIIKIVK